MKRRKPLRRKKPMRRVSERQKGRAALYYFLREPFMKSNPICQICGVAPSTDCHHRKGRYGALLFDQRWWMSLCRKCHMERVHGDVKNAIAKGWLVSKFQKD